MNWISNFVRPKIRALVNREVPENLWRKCPSCAQMIFHRELEANLLVCTHCGYHMRIGAKERLKAGLDEAGRAKPGLVEDVLDFVRSLAEGVRGERG